MAEFIMKSKVAEAGVSDSFYIESAATSMWEVGNDMYMPARLALDKLGVPYTPRGARQITDEDYETFDFIIGMDSSNISNLREFYGGDPDDKICRLLDFTDDPRDIADPYYTGNFSKAARDIEEGCGALLETLLQSGA